MEFVKNFTPPDFRLEILNRWQKFYTAAGSDGIDKFHLCVLFSIAKAYLCPIWLFLQMYARVPYFLQA